MSPELLSSKFEAYGQNLLPFFNHHPPDNLFIPGAGVVPASAKRRTKTSGLYHTFGRQQAISVYKARVLAAKYTLKAFPQAKVFLLGTFPATAGSGLTSESQIAATENSKTSSIEAPHHLKTFI